ncbi:MAG TPA: ATP synthase F1 subunit delta [Cytophagales bacterium]|jgi:F-type H+-transporting ATPase subunit delta|nr:ATP synthase F1 subunit delta [Cytophagales bacterium]
MSEIRIAARYAKSLITLATENGDLDVIHKDMQIVSESCKGSRELVLALRSPLIKFDKKRSILNAIFKDKVSSFTISFFDILTRKHREMYLHEISNEFVRQYNTLKGIQKAQLYTPVRIDELLRKQFVQMVEIQSGKKAEIEEFVKEDLIGGYILRIGDSQIDDSIKSKLLKIKTTFTENQYIPKL